MQKHFSYLLALLCAASARLPAQSLHRMTFSSGGLDNNQFTATMGEPIATYLPGSGAALSVGAQPGDDKRGVATKTPTQLLGVSVFPNPTSAFLHVQVAHLEAKNLFARLYDAQSRLLWDEPCAHGLNTFDLQTQGAGTYTLVVTDGEKSSAFQIIKLTH